MARAVGVQQADKALVDRRIQIVGEERFPMPQRQCFHHSFDRQFLIAYDTEQTTKTGTFRDELVRYLSGTCPVGRSGHLLRSGNNKRPILQLVVLIQKKIAEKKLKRRKYRLDL